MEKKYDHESENEREREVYCISLDTSDPASIEEFEEFMDKIQDKHVKHVEDVRKSLSLLLGKDISIDCACDVVYLRTRSRWTEELEIELIRLHVEGNPPNISDWPSPREEEEQV